MFNYSIDVNYHGTALSCALAAAVVYSVGNTSGFHHVIFRYRLVYMVDEDVEHILGIQPPLCVSYTEL